MQLQKHERTTANNSNPNDNRITVITATSAMSAATTTTTTASVTIAMHMLNTAESRQRRRRQCPWQQQRQPPLRDWLAGLIHATLHLLCRVQPSHVVQQRPSVSPVDAGDADEVEVERQKLGELQELFHRLLWAWGLDAGALYLCLGRGAFSASSNHRHSGNLQLHPALTPIPRHGFLFMPQG